MVSESVEIEVSDVYSGYLQKIRKEIVRAAENWFHIAYYVYELKYFEYYKGHYDNIVDCCLAEFGFKKSTTYNFINIVEQFGRPRSLVVGMNRLHAKPTYVGYADFISNVRGWSYSQLVAMLSLSDKDRLNASSDMSSRQIKMLKSVSDDSKRLENSNISHDVEISACSSDDSKRLEKLQIEFDNLKKLYDDERSSNHRINIKLVDVTSERDAALQQVDNLTEQIKRFKSDIKKLKSEIKSLKSK